MFECCIVNIIGGSCVTQYELDIVIHSKLQTPNKFNFQGAKYPIAQIVSLLTLCAVYIFSTSLGQQVCLHQLLLQQVRTCVVMCTYCKYMYSNVYIL